MLDNLRIFACAAEHGSLTKAASALGMTVATVSRRVGELERQLGCELFHRSTKGLILTPAGQSYFQECAGFINELDLRLGNLHAALHSLAGELKVMVPMNLGSGPLDAFWQDFVARHPDIKLRVEVGDPDADVIAHGADIALRSGAQRNSSLIQKHVGGVRLVLVAAAHLNAALPENLGKLNDCPSVAANLFGDWTLVNGDATEKLHKRHDHTSNDMRVILNLVKAGAGIALLPLSMVHQSLANGELARVLPPWEGLRRDIFLVWPYQRTLSARACVFRDELIEYLRGQSWFEKA
jgi:DNA-binding transcriptional LysR family regulator